MAESSQLSSRVVSSTASVTVVQGDHHLGFSPELGRVLLRIMRKAAARRGIDLDAADRAEVARLTSPAS